MEPGIWLRKNSKRFAELMTEFVTGWIPSGCAIYTMIHRLDMYNGPGRVGTRLRREMLAGRYCSLQ